MEATLTKKNIAKILPPALLAVYAYCCYLMAGIMLQYVPFHSDTAFLGIKQQYIDLPYYLPAFFVHVFATILVLPAGLTQFSKWLLAHYPTVHRTVGWTYVAVTLCLAAPSGFIIGVHANGGPSSQLAFTLLAVLWFWFTLQALRHARGRNLRQHRFYMYRSFALTLSAVTLRAWKYLIVYLLHPRPMDVYMVVAWLGWVLNLAVAEFIIHKQQSKV